MRGLVRRIGRIAGQAGDAHHAVVLGEIRLERPVVDRPVVRHAVQRPHAEVGRVHAREMRREEDRAAADAVEVGDLHQRVVVVDGIVGVPRAAVGADVEIGVAARFPVAAVGRKIGGLDPVALLEAQDLHARFGEAPGHRGAGGAGADDEHIDDLVGRAGARRDCWRRPSHAPRRRCRATSAAGRAPRPAATSRPAPAHGPSGRAAAARGPARLITRSSR